MRCKIVDFGKRLKELRTQAGLTQQQLGNLIGLSKTVISYYELRTRTPSPDVLIKLAAVFHVSADYLLGIDKKNGRTVDVSGLTDEEVKEIERMVEKKKKKK